MVYHGIPWHIDGGELLYLLQGEEPLGLLVLGVQSQEQRLHLAFDLLRGHGNDVLPAIDVARRLYDRVRTDHVGALQSRAPLVRVVAQHKVAPARSAEKGIKVVLQADNTNTRYLDQSNHTPWHWYLWPQGQSI